jgi:hypothetical protein
MHTSQTHRIVRRRSQRSVLKAALGSVGMERLAWAERKEQAESGLMAGSIEEDVGCTALIQPTSETPECPEWPFPQRPCQRRTVRLQHCAGTFGRASQPLTRSLGVDVILELARRLPERLFLHPCPDCVRRCSRHRATSYALQKRPQPGRRCLNIDKNRTLTGVAESSHRGGRHQYNCEPAENCESVALIRSSCISGEEQQILESLAAKPSTVSASAPQPKAKDSVRVVSTPHSRVTQDKTQEKTDAQDNALQKQTMFETAQRLGHEAEGIWAARRSNTHGKI